MSFVVLKFGGTSVSSLESWQRIAMVIRRCLQQKERPIVVCSALSQASNQLTKIISLAPSQEHHATLKDLIIRYQQLAVDLGVPTDGLLPDIEKLERLVEGVSLLQEASPRVQAQIMSFGELMLTHIGVAYLQRSGISVGWRDARQWLHSQETSYANVQTQYLAACCESEYDADLISECRAASELVLLTQGFIASNHRCETVLLGRGGSDVSAASLAAKLGALRCEIWTDVPGIYTANPQEIPQARHLRALDYDEAQEIALMGGKVLHPSAIIPCRCSNIPLHIRFTLDPDRQGTMISRTSEDNGMQIKSILTKSGVLLILIETVVMWQQVGFLADIFICFRNRGLSIDLLSTSESSVTVSLDRSIAEKNSTAINEVIADLNLFARAKLIGPCASISLVGRNIRTILHQLGSVFEVFEAQQVYLLSQAANDLNLTFVVDEDQVLRLAQKLHSLLIDQNPRSYYLSRSWQEEFGQFIPRSVPWWEEQREFLLSVAATQTPAYIYDAQTIKKSIEKLLACRAIDQVFYAMKANSYMPILKQFYQSGLNFECVSCEEIDLILRKFPKIDCQRILFTPNFAPREEYQKAIDLGVSLTVDNVYPLEQWPDVFKQQHILIRIDPGHGAGHHKFVVTGGNASKFGIPLDQLDRVCQLTRRHQIRVQGLHIHSGSGILNANNWRQTGEILLKLLADFPHVSVLNLGGGLGVVERPGQQPLDMIALDESLMMLKKDHPHLKIWLEPGRFLVAEAGVLLAQVTQLKVKGNIYFVGINTGMNSLLRPALYGAYHEIVNLTRLHEPKTIMANIVGPICESGDTLGYSRLLPETKEGDILLIATAGAYGAVMSSHYNQRLPAQESSIPLG